eukprot:15456186-Alexandrium_andersonii.AAC.1
MAARTSLVMLFVARLHKGALVVVCLMARLREGALGVMHAVACGRDARRGCTGCMPHTQAASEVAR